MHLGVSSDQGGSAGDRKRKGPNNPVCPPQLSALMMILQDLATPSHLHCEELAFHTPKVSFFKNINGTDSTLGHTSYSVKHFLFSKVEYPLTTSSILISASLNYNYTLNSSRSNDCSPAYSLCFLFSVQTSPLLE